MKFLLIGLFSISLFGQFNILNVEDPLAGSNWTISVVIPSPPTGSERYTIDVAIISDTTNVLLEFDVVSVPEPPYGTTHVPLSVHIPNWAGGELCIAQARIIDENGNVMTSLSMPVFSYSYRLRTFEHKKSASNTNPTSVSASVVNNGTTLRVSYTADTSGVVGGSEIHFVTVIIHDKIVCNVGLPIPNGQSEYQGFIDISLDPAQIGQSYSAMFCTSFGTGVTVTGTL